MSLTAVTKGDFREKMKVVRKELTTNSLSMESLSQGLFDLLERLRPQRLGAYFPIFGEPDLSKELISWATLTGCEIYCPVMVVEGMIYRRWIADGVMQKDAFGIVSPTAGATEETPDIVLIPCLGHDKKGHRLGYGKGCFDRYLSSHPDVVTIGLSFEKLRVPEMIFEDHDFPMNYLVTDKGFTKI